MVATAKTALRRGRGTVSVEGQGAPLRVAWFGHASGRRADGLSTYTTQTVRALQRRGVRVQVFAHRRDGDRAPGAGPVLLPSWRFKTVTIPLPGTRRRIAAELVRFAPHVVHISMSFSLLDAWIARHARRRGIPVVTTVHLPYAARRSARGRVLRALYRFQADALRRCDLCLALTQEQRDLLLSVGCAPDQVVVVPNGVDTRAICPGPSSLEPDLRGAFTVLYMGRLDPEKRVAALVRSFQRQRWPADHRLLIAGSGSQGSRLRRMVRDDRRIRLLGSIGDADAILDLLRAADVFVLPSTAEGLSLSLLEAMAAGCAVVATDAAESGAALDDAGLRLPVRPLEPALGSALRRLHDDPELRRVLSQRARARAETVFALDDRIDALQHLYERLLARVPAAA